MFFKKGALENLAEFTGKHLCQSLEFRKIFKNILFNRTAPMAASTVTIRYHCDTSVLVVTEIIN